MRTEVTNLNDPQEKKSPILLLLASDAYQSRRTDRTLKSRSHDLKATVD
jgi:hypothetical protein